MNLSRGGIQVEYDAGDGTFTVRRNGKTFITEGRLDLPEGVGPSRAVKVQVNDSLGRGEAIVISSGGGHTRRLALYKSYPFVCIGGSFRNETTESVVVKEITPMKAVIDVGIPADELLGFGANGLYRLDPGAKTHFCFGVTADPKTRAGVVCGWLSHYLGSGLVDIHRNERSIGIDGRSEYGRMVVPAGETVELETFAIGLFDDALQGLEMYADACAKIHNVKLPDKVPSGYCTWYHAAELDQEKAAELAVYCAKELKKFGFDFIQIDDGWQLGRRDFTDHNPAGKYPDGMKAVHAKITATGLTAGIWYIPSGWDWDCASLKDHPDYFIKHDDGSIYSVRWAGSCLDATNPDACAFLREVVARISKEWGYKYIKTDGQFSGMAVKMLYPSRGYEPDDFGDAVLYDPTKTQVYAYRKGFELVREAAGDDVFILGCNVPQNGRCLGASIGVFDGLRIGHDVGAEWEYIRTCMLAATDLYFFHNKTWFNDPDCLMLRDPLTLDQARAWGSLIAISGQMNVVSEWLPDLPSEKLDVVKRTMPNHGGLGRPVDLFENDLPRIWHLPSEIAGKHVDLIGLFNWDEKNSTAVELDLAKIGLNDRYVGFDFWENKFVGPFEGVLRFELRPSSCRMVSLHGILPNPQLVGTSRHVTQGVIDVLSLDWDEDKCMLKGRSKIVGGDPYELRIVSPIGFKATGADVSEEGKRSGTTITVNQNGTEVRVMINSPKCRRESWQVRF